MRVRVARAACLPPDYRPIIDTTDPASWCLPARLDGSSSSGAVRDLPALPGLAAAGTYVVPPSPLTGCYCQLPTLTSKQPLTTSYGLLGTRLWVGGQVNNGNVKVLVDGTDPQQTAQGRSGGRRQKQQQAADKGKQEEEEGAGPVFGLELLSADRLHERFTGEDAEADMLASASS